MPSGKKKKSLKHGGETLHIKHLHLERLFLFSWVNYRLNLFSLKTELSIFFTILL